MRSSAKGTRQRDRDPTLGRETTLGATDRAARSAEAALGAGGEQVEPTLVSSDAGPAPAPNDGIGDTRGRLMAELLGRGLTVRLVATGHSMSPFIRSGDTLEIEPLASTARFGDVVAVASEGRLVVHRVVSFRNESLRVRGDVAPHDDPPIDAATVLGRVARVVRAGRHVRFGLGLERIAVAWASRMGLLRHLAGLREGLRFQKRPPSGSPGEGIRVSQGSDSPRQTE